MGETKVNKNIDYIGRIAREKLANPNRQHNITPQELAYSVNNYTRAKILEFEKDERGRLNIVRPVGKDRNIVIALDKQANGNTIVTHCVPDADTAYVENLQKNKGANILYDTIGSPSTTTPSNLLALSRLGNSTSDSVANSSTRINPNTQRGNIGVNRNGRNTLYDMQIKSIPQQSYAKRGTTSIGDTNTSIVAKTTPKVNPTNRTSKINRRLGDTSSVSGRVRDSLLTKPSGDVSSIANSSTKVNPNTQRANIGVRGNKRTLLDVTDIKGNTPAPFSSNSSASNGGASIKSIAKTTPKINPTPLDTNPTSMALLTGKNNENPKMHFQKTSENNRLEAKNNNRLFISRDERLSFQFVPL
jgi:hypothetical protein